MKSGKLLITRKEILRWVILCFGLFYSAEVLAWGLWGKKETGDYLIQKKGDSNVYVVHEKKKYYIPPDMLEVLGYEVPPVKILSPKKFDSIPFGEDEWLEVRIEQILSSRLSPRKTPPLPEGLQEGNLIRREGDYRVYVIHDGKKHLVKDRKEAEDRGYSLSEAIVVSTTLFDSIPEGEGNYLSARVPIDKVPPQEKYYPPYEEVFRGLTNPYKEDQTGYNYPYPTSSEQLYGGEFKRFEEKIFGNVRDNILSPRELEERRRLEEEAKLNRRYLEEQIRYQQEQTRLLGNSYNQPYNYPTQYSWPAGEANTPLSASDQGDSVITSNPPGMSSPTQTVDANASAPMANVVDTVTPSYPS
ncbi:MAG: hypothetical protein ACK4WF_09045, partial [Candidatus Brocadiales bacterium]